MLTCFNVYISPSGEIFGGLPVPAGQCDGELLRDALSKPGADIALVLSQLDGPWAVVYWQHQSQTLWIGRDAFGRLPITP